ncbi:MAG: mechanosensitive ion channel family protein [Verrucomicrobiota bacterium]|nr:mechanosensitive ion channel family protein [Verrucomicrobiota bacterium]
MPETAAEICEKPEVKEELARATGQRAEEKAQAKARTRLWFLPHALFFLGCAIFYYLVGSNFIPLPKPQIDLIRRILRGIALITLVLGVAKASKVYALAHLEDAVTRFTLHRIQKLIVGIVIALIAVSVIFVNWYAALTALGVGSIVLGLAVQTPMTSFIGWIYLLVRRPYRVGDRIEIADATGDVIDIGYIDTTLWEFGGKYLSTDHPSGRIIKFPNSKVLNSVVFNYSWPLFPYIWNEIKFQIAYQSDLQFVARTMEEIVQSEIGDEMEERVAVYRNLLGKTPVDELEVRAHPRVFFRVDEVTWVDAIVRYVVPPREAGAVKNRLIPKLLAALNAAPDKVMFPAGANR